jgi:FAD synthetase
LEDLDLLRAVYSATLRDGHASEEGLSADMAASGDGLARRLEAAVLAGTLQRVGQAYVLTPKGRSMLKVVMIGGAFEIIHPGHLHTIEQAKKLGNTLVVIVATDKTVNRNKGREPVTKQEWRVKLVSAVRGVDVGLPGGQGSIYDTLEKVRPDIVALGYDQTHNPADIEAEAKRRGLERRVVRLTSPLPDVKTSKIVSTL